MAFGIAVVSVVVGLRRRPADPAAQADWEATFAREKALAIEKYLADVPPELREERRRGIESEFAKVEAKERRKRGYLATPTPPDSG